MQKEKYDLDTPLIKLGGEGDNSIFWTARHAVEGVQIFGGIGSGKTSGSGRMIALKYLAAGFGGLILTAKPDEKELWEQYCSLAGRTDDLIIVDPTSNNFFNFLDYEGEGDAITDNIVQVLKTVIRAGDSNRDGGSDDRFWEDALDLLIFNVIDLCKLAYGTVTIQNMYEIVQALPKRDQVYSEKKRDAFQKAFSLAQKNVRSKVDAWEKSIDKDEFLKIAAQPDYEEILCESVPDARTFRFVVQFCTERFTNLADRTRNTIEFTFSAFLFRLLRDPVYSLFCHHKSTFTPEVCLDGKIILLNLPVKKYHKVGRDCQIMFKYI